jgi:sarcosine oxidase subunit beta
LKSSADVVIVGGGIIGCSTAYQLAGRGANVVVLERNTVGSGSTSKAAGGIRVQFSTPIHIEFTLRSIPVWKRFQEEFGIDCEYRQWGYLFLAGSEDDMEVYRKTTALQRAHGGNVQLIGPDDVAKLVPGLRTDDLLGAAWGPEDGFANPNSACEGFANGARARGVEIVQGCEVTGIDVVDGKVRGVQTSQGPIATEKVLNAAGPWCAELAKKNGIDLPFKPINRQIFLIESPPSLPYELPLVINTGRDISLRREGRETIGLSCVDNDQPPTLEPSVDYNFLTQKIGQAVHRIPALENAQLRGGYAGIIEHTPDKHAILDKAPGIEGYFLAVGFSGHGFQHSPIIGTLMSELILDGQATTVDITPMRYSRFAEGKLNEELMIMLKPKWEQQYTERLVRDVAKV